MTEQHESVEEVRQVPERPIAVPVEVDGVVHVHRMPTRHGAMKSTVIGTTTEQVLNRNPKRNRAVLMSRDQAFYAGTDRNDVDQDDAVLWPKDVPLELHHSREVWVKSATATTVLNIISEGWAD